MLHRRARLHILQDFLPYVAVAVVILVSGQVTLFRYDAVDVERQAVELSAILI